MLHGQPREESLWSSGKTHIACLAIEKPPCLYLGLAPTDRKMRVDGHRLNEENNPKMQRGTSAEIILITLVF